MPNYMSIFSLTINYDVAKLTINNHYITVGSNYSW